MNRCAECQQPLSWRDSLPMLWEGAQVYLFCSLPCRDHFHSRIFRPLRAG